MTTHREPFDRTIWRVRRWRPEAPVLSEAFVSADLAMASAGRWRRRGWSVAIDKSVAPVAFAEVTR